MLMRNQYFAIQNKSFRCTVENRALYVTHTWTGSSAASIKDHAISIDTDEKQSFAVST